jgi:Domain of unknown function (DUF4292)
VTTRDLCMQRITFILLLVFALLLQACSKKVVPTLPPLAKTLDIQEIDFEYMHGKARMNFKDDKKDLDVKANIRIRKDSVIWMTFSVVGVQGGKALINKDSVTIVSNVDKEYYVFDYPELSKRFNFNVDYATIQSAMLGNLIIPRAEGDHIIEDIDFNRLNQQQGTVTIKNFVNRASQKLEMVELTESTSNNSIKINYSNFQPLGDKSFPYTGMISVLYKTTAGIVSNSITFEYNKAEVGDKELRFPFNIPKRYERR